MKKRFIASGIVTATTLSSMVTAPVLAIDSLKEQAQDAVTDAGGTGGASLGDIITDIVNALIFIVGAASVIMIVIGGIRYVVSGGDANATQGAKNTIMYAIIGLVVAVVAYSLVNFVINSL